LNLRTRGGPSHTWDLFEAKPCPPTEAFSERLTGSFSASQGFLVRSCPMPCFLIFGGFGLPFPDDLKSEWDLDQLA